ncbi:hypothetical protein D3C71_1583940 [compost metagenome]
MRSPYFCQCDCTPNGIRDVPGQLYTSHATCKHPVRCLEIPYRPGYQSQECSCCATPEMIVLRYEVEHLPGIFHGGGYITERLGICGTVACDRTREAAEFLFIHDDHLNYRLCRWLPHVCRRLQPPLSIS